MPYLDARIFAVSERSDELALARLGAAAVLLCRSSLGSQIPQIAMSRWRG
jgi:hypothetical protein